LAGIDLLTGKVHALVRDRHRSREFIEFLKSHLSLDNAKYAPGHQVLISELEIIGRCVGHLTNL
jgi:hypothetical protein